MNWRKLRRSIVFPWAIAFLLLNLFVTQDGEKNPLSRFAALRAITEQHSFRIDDYKDWTIDWSQGPDGHYYSNKAPGSILLAVPVFWALDTISLLWERNNFDERGLRKAPGYFQKTALSFLLQALPFAWLTILLVEHLAGLGVSVAARHFTALALFFGNTAALFMNSWFGHGFMALFILWACYELLRRRFLWYGVALSCALLCEYQVAVVLPFFAVLAWLWEKNLRWLGKAVLGALPAGLLWVWYHASAFGSPFALATQYYNPAFRDVENISGNLYGVLTPVPRFEVIWALLFGPSRGILFTQPWILVLAFATMLFVSRPRRSPRRAQFFALCLSLATLALLTFNSMVGSWNGGYTAGPRYLSFIFPAWAVLAGLSYDSIGKGMRKVLWASLGFALLFRGLVYGTTILAPDTPLWPWFVEKFLGAHAGTAWLRFTLFLLTLSIALIVVRRNKLRLKHV